MDFDALNDIGYASLTQKSRGHMLHKYFYKNPPMILRFCSGSVTLESHRISRSIYKFHFQTKALNFKRTSRASSWRSIHCHKNIDPLGSNAFFSNNAAPSSHPPEMALTTLFIRILTNERIGVISA